MNVPRAIENIEALLKLPNISKEARYYAESALSHLYESVAEATARKGGVVPSPSTPRPSDHSSDTGARKENDHGKR